ncbi:MmcQ/YjbR family DNA-binding protein [Kineococcus endophyticus]
MEKGGKSVFHAGGAASVRGMATYDDVARVAVGLAEVTETDRRGTRVWNVAGKAFAWERPFTGADRKRFAAAGIEPTAGPVLALACADLQEKGAVLSQGTPGLFDMEHFHGYAAYLVALDDVADTDLEVAVQDAWAAKAPDRLLR